MISSGFINIRILAIKLLIHTDLPLPVEPATSKWGIFAISAQQVLPIKSFPKATSILASLIFLGIELNTSLIGTAAIFLFGISIPTVLLPGIGASILTSLAARARAISLLILVILLTLVPALISTSNWVTAGPSWIATTLPVIWKSFKTFSKAILFWFKNSVPLPLLLFLSGFKISRDGSL